MTTLQKNSIHQVTVENYSSEGMGVARIDGQVVFIHRALAGEVCDIQIIKIQKNIAFARVVEVVTPSAHRREPDCPWYGRCGGCDFRHMDYAEECAAKRQRVQDALTRVGGSDVVLEEFYGAADTLHYRNKSQYPVSADGRIGFYKARSHEVVEVEACQIQHSAADATAAAVRAYLKKYAVTTYDEKTGKGLLRHVYTRVNRQGECLCCLLVNGPRLPHERDLVDIIRHHVPETVGVVVGVNRKSGNVILGDRYRTLLGQDYLMDTLCGFSFRLSVPSFYQVNTAQAETLYNKALEFAALTGTETVLDLYCGIGTITLCLARQAGRVIGAEVVPEAVADAEDNAARNNVENVEFFCGDAAAVAEKLLGEGLRPDVVTVDPPRKGLEEAVVGHIASMAPAKWSTSPATRPPWPGT